MLAMTGSFTPPQTHGVKARRFEVEDFARCEGEKTVFSPTGTALAKKQTATSGPLAPFSATGKPIET